MSERTADLITEIAATAARLIAEEGLDYASAKRKALHTVVGTSRPSRGLLPDNAQVESELRRWLSTFDAAEHLKHLHALRTLALQLMQRLTAFAPHLTGAALNGTATRHSDIHLQLFTDSAKDVEHFLLNEGVDFEVFEEPNAQEQIQFVVMPERIGVVLEIYEPHALRVAPRSTTTDPNLHPIEASGRASITQLQRLLAECA